MDYDIIRGYDINRGVILTLSIPIKDVDWNALYTLESDFPEFIVPFKYQQIDDTIEMVFYPEKRSPLRYFRGTKSTSDYCAIFTNLLIPLQNCTDWFMKPFCFVLEYDWIFYDSTNHAISYLYIPTKQSCASANNLTEMVKHVSQNFQVSDQSLENKVLRAITDSSFRIKDFLQIFKDTPPAKQAPKAGFDLLIPEKESKLPPSVNKNHSGQVNKIPEPKKEVKNSSQKPTFTEGDDSDWDSELNIHIGKGPNAKEKDSVFSPEKRNMIQMLFGKEDHTKDDKEKQKKKKKLSPKESKPSSPDSARQIIAGAVSEALSNSQQREARLREAAPPQYAETVVTVIKHKRSAEKEQVYLEYVGPLDLPSTIPVTLDNQSMFTIGRFDIGLNKKQSDFEFPPNTKEVSRHHAVIELIGENYYIVDIGSLAGTFINNEEAIVNKHYQLSSGDRISFGRAGADYIFRNA